MMRGEACWKAVLNPSSVLAIRASPARYVDLAAKYGTSASNIVKIRNRETWAWLI